MLADAIVLRPPLLLEVLTKSLWVTFFAVKCGCFSLEKKSSLLK